MKPQSMLCVVCLWIAGFSPCAHAQAQLLAGMPSGVTSLDPQMLQAVNAFLEAANTGDPEKAAACVHFENDAARAQFIREMRRQMDPAVQSGRWEGVCFQELKPLDDGSGGFWLQYGLCTKSEFGTRGISGTSLSVQRVDGVWKVVTPRLVVMKPGTYTFTIRNGKRDALEVKLQEMEKENPVAPWVAAMAQTRTLPDAQGLSMEDKMRNTPVLQTSADIIRAVQAHLPDTQKANVFLFAFKETQTQLTLLGALPLSGKTPEDNPPVYRLNDGLIAGYRVKAWNENGPIAGDFSYRYSNLQEGNQMSTITANIPSLPADACYPISMPHARVAGKTPDMARYVLVLAHLPLTANAFWMEAKGPTKKKASMMGGSSQPAQP